MRYRYLFWIIVSLFIQACGNEEIPQLLSPFNNDTEDEDYTQYGIDVQLLGEPSFVYRESLQVPIYPEIEVTVDGANYDLYLTGYEVRKKKIVFFSVDVYVLSSYLTRPEKDLKSDAMAGVEASEVDVLVLTLLRNVDGESINDAFMEALEDNGENPDNPDLDPLFEELEPGVMKGEQVMLISAGADSSRMIIFRNDSKRDFLGTNVGYILWKIFFMDPIPGGITGL